MKRNVVLWQFIGFVAVSLLGTLLHFLYSWTGITFTAVFSAVNESTWEHMKLLFFPMFLFAIVQNFSFGKEYPAFWCVKLKGAVIGLLLIPVLFYTLRGVFGTTPDWVNIAIFFVAAAFAFIYEAKQLLIGNTKCPCPKIPLAVLCLVAVAFGIFTFAPPEIPLFQDPVSGGFGI